MSYAVPIDQILGGEAAGVLVRQFADALKYHDSLPSDIAYRVACERVADGDPHVIAAPGQSWVVRPELAPYLPVSRYAIKRRDNYNTCAIVVAFDGPLAGAESEIELFDLAHGYQLEAWFPIDPDLANPFNDSPGDPR